MRLTLSLPFLALFALTHCTRAESQGGGPRLEAKLPAAFAQLSNVVELSDGRVIFAETRDKVFLRGDLKSGKVDTLGTRVDSLPRTAPADRYKFPGWVAHLAGDTVGLVDFSGLRTTLWSERGRALGVLPLPAVAGSAPVLLYDTVGHGYKIDYQAIMGGNDPGKTVLPDSIPILRIALKSGKVDTVARLAAPEYGPARFGEQIQQAAKVFAPNDVFGVLADGSAWVARGAQNRVDWRAPDGRWTIGKPHPFTKVPVTQADKDRVVAQIRERGKEFGMPQDLKVEYPFAESKPPFDFALGRPGGEVWLQRPRADSTSAAIYDVFDRQGVWRRELTLPTGSYLAGFGRNGAVYAVIREGERRTIGRFRAQ